MDEKNVQDNRREFAEQATAKRATILGLQYLDTRDIEATLPLATGLMTTKEMHLYRMVPLIKGSEHEQTTFGITSQTPQSVIQKMDEVYNAKGGGVLFLLISNSAFNFLISRYDPQRTVVYDDIKIAKEGDSDTLIEVSKTLNSVRSDQMFDYLIDQADRLAASDIHIENQRTFIRIRMRIDGMLHSVAHIDKDRYRIIIAELGSRANISSASVTPQSGHMSKEVSRDGATHILNLRIETVPTMYGQDTVMRLFNFDTANLNLDLLSIGEREMSEIREIVSHPRGMMLLVGPTGSGKSTTLYSILNALNTDNRKIITLEDPIENSIPGITQIPINTTAGVEFAEGLRSVLRLDPDVVMIGEIRDMDTARTAIQASITGHLVLSSFHANSTSAAFSRMIDMIGQNPIFSSAVRLLIAQRLVRKLWDGGGR